jgi:hypothetical protein
MDTIAALRHLRTFDEKQTIGELLKAEINSPAQRSARLKRIHAQAVQDAIRSSGGNTPRARAMADDFMARVVADMPPPDITARELIVSIFTRQGIDEEEIRDDCVFAALNRLGAFRSQLRVAASETGRSFDTLKEVPMEILPSGVIGDALKAHGQVRARRPRSDLNDGYLAALSPYCAVLYVDKRTAEDFCRALHKEPSLTGLIGEIVKTADFEGLLE